ncbi:MULTISPECIES: polyhydroxyalkanoate synthesis repressor PhaR [Methylobacterium]|nr:MULTISPECIES: polyhydroxyalkanoate synthesis repressor PhaR [Methylobacterium]TXN20560.1 polyhydroxyalkanoate synthesis repressor PhaR [Methylobacterium sp. WL9]
MADNGKSHQGKSHQTVIKKYANRRLYHTGTSTYVTLEDLAGMVQSGEDFVVYDARSGDDITRSVLTQIIFEQENKAGEDNLLPVAFLRQLIRFYGDSMRIMVPSFLEFSMANFAKDQDGLREKFSQSFQSFGPGVFQQALQEQVRANMSFFGDAMKMFTGGFTPPGGKPDASGSVPAASNPGSSDFDDLKRQMLEMQARLDALAKK